MIEIVLSSTTKKHSLTLYSNNALYALRLLKTLFSKHVITEQSWSSDDVASVTVSELFIKQVCSAQLSSLQSASWPEPRRREKSLFQLDSYTDSEPAADGKNTSKKLTPVFVTRWQLKSRQLVMNLVQLGLGWRVREHQARLFGRSSHGFQYRVVDDVAGILLTLVLNIPGRSVEVLCNDKDFALARMKRSFLGMAGPDQQHAKGFEEVFMVNGKAALSGWSKQHKIRRKFLKAVAVMTGPNTVRSLS